MWQTTCPWVVVISPFPAAQRSPPARFITSRGVQLQLLLDQWDIRLWVTKGTFQPDECYLYTRKWYTLDDADLTEITDWFAKEGYADLTDERVSQLIESHKLANGYFF